MCHALPRARVYYFGGWIGHAPLHPRQRNIGGELLLGNPREFDALHEPIDRERLSGRIVLMGQQVTLAPNEIFSSLYRLGVKMQHVRDAVLLAYRDP